MSIHRGADYINNAHPFKGILQNTMLTLKSRRCIYTYRYICKCIYTTTAFYTHTYTHVCADYRTIHMLIISQGLTKPEASDLRRL